MIQENSPLVTAVIPVYNHEKYVAASIKSIIGQTYSNIELIIINDGSRDHSHEVVLTLAEECTRRFSRFEYLNRENLGLCATLNEALSLAKGEYLSLLASDDIALAEKIEVLVRAMESIGGNSGAAFGNALFIDDEGRKIALNAGGGIANGEDKTACNNYLDFRTAHGKLVDYRSEKFGSYASLLLHNYLPAMSGMIKTQFIRDVGAWTNGNASEDWELWRKLAKRYKFVYVDEPLALYRWHESNSVKKSSGNLKYWSFRLFRAEKEYCEEIGLGGLWKEAYPLFALPLLADSTVPLGKKLSLLNAAELASAAPFLIGRLARKAIRALRNQTPA